MTYKIKVGSIISKIDNDREKYKVFMISESYLGKIYHLINIKDNTSLNISSEETVYWKRSNHD